MCHAPACLWDDVSINNAEKRHLFAACGVDDLGICFVSSGARGYDCGKKSSETIYIAVQSHTGTYPCPDTQTCLLLLLDALLYHRDRTATIFGT